MDKRKTLLSKIANIISFYAETIRSNVESGRTDILIDAEEICCSLLNKSFGYDLKLLNQAKRNFPAIDMADEQHRVAVQVTSSNTRAKVQNTLNSFLEHRLNGQYDTLLVFILVAAPKFRQRVDFSVPDGMELKIMTFLDLIRELENAERERLEEVAKYLEEAIGTDTVSSSADAIPATVSTGAIKGLTENARQVFNFAGFLPEAGLERNVFEYGLEPLQRKALPDLLEQGVLYQKETIIRLHPDVRNQAQAQTVQDHALFLDRLWDYEKSWHWDRVSLKREISLKRSLARVYETAAEYFPERAVVYALRSAELYRNTQQYEQALRLEEKALQFLESVRKDHWGAARAHHFAGECYTALREHAHALKEWEKTLSLCKGSQQVSGMDLAEAYHNVGRALTALEQYNDAEQKLLNALKLLEEFRKTCPDFAPQPWMKGIYDSLAAVYAKRDLNEFAALCSKNALLSPARQEALWMRLSPKRREPLLNLPMPIALQSRDFVGRQEELDRIDKELAREGVAFLSGLGGMGKTELALRYGGDYHDAGRGMVYFVRFSGSFHRTVVENIAPNILGFNLDGLPEEQIFARAMAVLRRCSADDLLILDNADDPEDSMYELCRELKILPMRVLVTTRARIDEAIVVGRLENEALYDIFRNHNVYISESKMDELIAAVDGHALTVDLMARLLNRERQPNAFNDLRDALAERELALIHPDAEKQTRIHNHLKAVFSMTNLSQEQQVLLRFAALLPNCGLDEELFVTAAVQEKKPGFLGRFFQKQEEPALDTPRKVRDILEALADGGWLEWERDVLKIHPVICIVCREVLKPTEKNCQAFLLKLWEWYDPKRYDRAKIHQLAELFAGASDILGDPHGRYIGFAGYLWNVLTESRKALTCNLRAVELLEQVSPDSDKLAAAYANVGTTYDALGDYKRALEYQLKALAIREKVLPPEHPDLVSSCNYVGTTCYALGDHQKALEYQLKALAIWKRVLPPEHPNLAVSYNNVGITYYALGDQGKALEYQLKALAIREKVLPPEHPDLAASYNNVGYCYGTLGDHEQALMYMARALAIREKILPPEHPDLAGSYHNMGYTYGDLGNHEHALEYHLKALAVREKALPPEHPDIARSCYNIASVYYDMGDYQCALEYMRRAVDIAEQSLPEGHPERVKYRADLENLERDIRQ